MNKEAIRQRLIEELNLNTDNLFTNLLSHALAWHERTKELKADLAHSADTIAALKKDAERLDWLERCIRDGSYQSIIHDIAAVCQSSYQHFGNGPAIRTAIDGARPTEEPSP